MTVTRDVILDLLPLYFAGQVSNDTQALVEEFLQNDPDFARMSQRFDALLRERHDPEAPDAAERRTFERARMLVRYRNQMIGFAIAYSLLPFAFFVRGGRLEFVFGRSPLAAAMFGVAALACWVAVYVLGRRARSVRL